MFILNLITMGSLKMGVSYGISIVLVLTCQHRIQRPGAPIFFTTYLYRAWGGMAPSAPPPPGSATACSCKAFSGYEITYGRHFRRHFYFSVKLNACADVWSQLVA